jgi:mannose-6-phosphate isomerase-like protein (cupin superfamily)/predicted GNAT family N-acyltransferase
MVNIKSIHNAEHYNWGDGCDGWNLLLSGTLAVIEERMPPGASDEVHYHAIAQQVFYILKGMASFEINGKEIIVSPHETIHVPARTLHKISNMENNDLKFLVISEPESHADKIEIIEYVEEYKDAIKLLNVEWLEKYFAVEPIDVLQLSNPKEEVIGKGGFIFYARQDEKIIGTYSLLKMDDDIYELGKMAVTATSQGKGIGKALMEHSIITARQKGIKKLILYSNTKLDSAIHLYRKYGYKEIKMDSSHYVRSNIKMEKII